MTKAPAKWQLRNLVTYALDGEVKAQVKDGQWVPARPCGFFSLRERLRLAYGVFIGKYDVVEWDGGQ